MSGIVILLIKALSGAAGGGLIGRVVGMLNGGNLVNTLLGAAGGVGATSLLGAGAAGGLGDISSILTMVAGGAGGGAVLGGAGGFIKNLLAK